MAKKDPKVNQLYVGLQLAKELRKEIFDFLQYDAVSIVMNNTGFGNDNVSDTVDKIFKNSIRVSDKMMKPLYDMLILAKERLGFKEPIDLYVVNNSTFNASATLSFDPETPHLIQLFSGLVNHLSDEEVLSVIGHEIGHLMGRDAEVGRLFDFIYEDDEDIPWFLNAKLQILLQLNEIRCDRCGCIASGTLEPNVTSQFSMMCGVRHNRFVGEVQEILARCSSNVEMIKNGQISPSCFSHPDHPIRMRAMEIFCNCKDKKQMEKEMAEIIDLVNLWNKDEMGKHYADFMVSAGLMVANADGNITDEEIGIIISDMVEYKMFPIRDYKKIAKKDIEKVFRRSVKTILDARPYQADYLMKYILRMVVADQHINPKEVELASQLSQEVFNMEPEEFSDCYAEVLREYFHPRYVI